MSIALKNFVDEINPYKKKLIILLIDQAGFHMAKNVVIPEGIQFYPLPPYTPELQPAECLWPLLKEAVANNTFNDLEELQNVLIKRCQWLIKHLDIVKGASGFKWICDALKGD